MVGARCPHGTGWFGTATDSFAQSQQYGQFQVLALTGPVGVSGSTSTLQVNAYSGRESVTLDAARGIITA